MTAFSRHLFLFHLFLLLLTMSSVVAQSAGDAPLPREVMPLLRTQWDQWPYYNAQAPLFANSDRQITNAATGCVATAMAQVMRYWQWPKHGYGAHGYDFTGTALPYAHSWSLGPQYADLGATTYRYDLMPTKLTDASSSSSVKAVATLMRQCGVAVDMYYNFDGEGGSDASFDTVEMRQMGRRTCAARALTSHFGYKPSARTVRRRDYRPGEWDTLLMRELAAGRPVLYGAFTIIDGDSTGHCFVIDGYDVAHKFHVNWGWSGDGDGYFRTSSLSAFGIDFTGDQAALLGLEPDSAMARRFTVTYDRRYTLIYSLLDESHVSVALWDGAPLVDSVGRPSDSFAVPQIVTYGGTSYTVSALESHAFAGCRWLTSLTLPASIDSLGDSVVADCPRLGAVHLLSPAPPHADSSAFDDAAEGLRLHVSCGLYNNYATHGGYAHCLIVDSCQSPLGMASPVDASPLVFPNPATDYVVLLSPSSTTATITNADGRTMASLRLAAGTPTRLSTAQWPHGIYLVHLDGVEKPTKVVIMH